MTSLPSATGARRMVLVPERPAIAADDRVRRYRLVRRTTDSSPAQPAGPLPTVRRAQPRA